MGEEQSQTSLGIVGIPPIYGDILGDGILYISIQTCKNTHYCFTHISTSDSYNRWKMIVIYIYIFTRHQLKTIIFRDEGL